MNKKDKACQLCVNVPPPPIDRFYSPFGCLRCPPCWPVVYCARLARSAACWGDVIALEAAASCSAVDPLARLEMSTFHLATCLPFSCRMAESPLERFTAIEREGKGQLITRSFSELQRFLYQLSRFCHARLLGSKVEINLSSFPGAATFVQY
jgi:hypothetical protein